MKHTSLAARFTILVAGRPLNAIVAFVALVILVGLGLSYFTLKQTDVEGEQCKVACAAKGKLFVYLPDQMAESYPYAKISPNCACYGSLEYPNATGGRESVK